MEALEISQIVGSRQVDAATYEIDAKLPDGSPLDLRTPSSCRIWAGSLALTVTNKVNPKFPCTCSFASSEPRRGFAASRRDAACAGPFNRHQPSPIPPALHTQTLSFFTLSAVRPIY